MKKNIQGIAVFNEKKIKGVVTFTEENNEVIIDIDIEGLKKNGIHGFHIHEAGDLTDHCESLCAHFNPYNKNHGCPGMKERHVGDLGNLIQLRGSKCNILGRGLIIHADPDDCGQGENEDSLKTGNSGKRIACAIIGYSKENFKNS